MSNYYQGTSRHLVAVDCVIFGYEDDLLKILLFPRRVEPAQGEWSLMGGFVDENESIDDAAIRVLQLFPTLCATRAHGLSAMFILP